MSIMKEDFSYKKIPFNRVSDFLEKLKGYVYTDNICKQDFINLSTSENFSSSLVRLSNLRFQGGNSYNDIKKLDNYSNIIETELKKIAENLGKSMFECEVFNFDVYSSQIAQQAILLGTCNYGDSILYFKKDQYENSSIEELARKCKIEMYNIPIYEKNFEINMNELEKIIKNHPEIKVIMLNKTIQLREESLMSLRNIVPDSVVITYDCSHNAGLISSGLLPQPLMMGIDILYGCTNTTIPGPQNGFIAFKSENNPYYNSILDWCKTYSQTRTKNEHVIPLLISLYEMKFFGREYCKQVVENTKSFAKNLSNEGFDIYSKNEESINTNQLFIVIGSLEKTEFYRNKKLLLAGIYADIIKISGENNVFGLKIGTQAMTRRGFTKTEFEEVAKMLGNLILKDELPENIKFEIKSFMSQYPLFPLKFSFDEFSDEILVKEFLCEVFR